MHSLAKLPTRRLSIIVVIVVALGAVAGAWAYFSATGSATAHASVGTLNPPSNVATSQNSAGAVTITWNAATLSTGGSVQGYTVKRSDGTVVCGSPTLVTGLSCTDSATTPGSTYTYTVTAVYNSFTASATSASVTITALSAPTLSAKPSSPSANAAPSFSFSGGGGTGYQCQLDGGTFTNCTSPASYSALSSGSHTFKVHAIQGGVTGPDTTYTWTIDSSAPSITAEPGNPSNASSPSFSFSHASYSSFQCSIDGGAYTACSSPKTYSSLVDGSHTFSVKAIDADGVATSAASYTWTVDTTAPSLSLTKVNGNTVTFPYTTNQTVTSIGGSCGTAPGDLVTVSWAVSGGATESSTTSCSSGSWSVTLPTALSSEATYTLSASQSDSAGNTGTTGNQTLIIDKTAPSVSLTKVNGNTVTFPYTTNQTVTSIGGGCGTATGDFVTVSWAVSGGATESSTTSCSSGSWSVTLPTALSSEATYTLSASQSDSAGNTGTTGNQTLTIDTSSPSVSITSPASNSTTLPNPTLSGAAGTASGDASTVTVKLYSGSSATGTPVETVNNVAVSNGSWSTPVTKASTVGTYTAQVTQTDTAGNTGTATSTFTVSTVTITSPTNGSFTNDTTPTISGAASTNASVVVKIYSGTTAAGTPVQTSPNITPTGSGAPYAWSWTSGARTAGTYTIQATQTTALSNPVTITIDVTAPPAPTITTSPASTTNQTSASFAFTDTEAGVSYQCKLDGAAYAACTSPASYSSLAQGSHTFSVQAKDAAGNVSTAASYTWTVDTTMPTVTLTKVNGTAVTFPYTTNQTVTSIGGTCGTASGDLVTVTWAVSGGATESATTSCSSGNWNATLTTALSSEASYTLSASQSDSAGNTGTTGNQTLTIDKTPPVGLTSWTTANGNGTAGKLDQNDTITLNFSEAIDPSSIISGWTDASSKTGQPVTVKLADSGPAPSTNDTVTICAAADTSCATPLSIGTINLKGNYINSSSGTGVAIFPGSGSGAKSVITGNAVNPTTLTVTLGAMSQLGSGVTLQTVSTTSQAIWSGWSFSDLAGNQASNIASATQANAQQQF